MKNLAKHAIVGGVFAVGVFAVVAVVDRGGVSEGWKGYQADSLLRNGGFKL